MKKDTIKYVRLGFGILTGAAAVAAGICLMAACITIYNSGGEQLYTPEKVAAAFSPIAGMVYLALALAIGGLVLDLLLPRTDPKRKAEKNYAAILERLLEKRDVDTCDHELRQAIRKERTQRKREGILSLVILAVCSIGFLFYGANPTNFHQSEINSSMLKAVTILFCCLAVPFGFALGAAYRSKASFQREIELVKQIPAGEKKHSHKNAQSDKGLMAARLVLVCVAVVLLVYGFFAGGTADVLTKAVNICTECVGLG